MKQSIVALKAKSALQTLVKNLLNLFLFLKARHELLEKLKNKLNELDNNNQEYTSLLKDARENMRMNLMFIILIISFFVDYFLLYGSLDILCDEFGWWFILKFIVPVALIILEIIISYFTIVHSRDGENYGISKILQYLIFPVLAGFSLLALFYYFHNYNKDIDHMSLLSYMSFNVILQMLLLVSSIMLHLWLIKHAEEIAEAVAYTKYKVQRFTIVNKIERIEKANTTIYFPLFTKLAHKYVQDIDAFKRNYPEIYLNLSSTMPQELIDAINKVMGKKSINSNAEDSFVSDLK